MAQHDRAATSRLFTGMKFIYPTLQQASRQQNWPAEKIRSAALRVLTRQIGSGMRIISVLFACLCAMVGSFWVTTLYLDGRTGFMPSSVWSNFLGGRAPSWSLLATPANFRPVLNAVVKQVGTGVEITSLFNADHPKDGTDGAVYHFAQGNTPVFTGQTVTVAFEITTAIYDGMPHEFEVMVAQNGLKAGGWRKLTAKGGRNIYAIEFEPATEKRAIGDRVDSIWLRSDASGHGLPLIVHEIRVYRN